jgi:hypothetical protein
MSITDQDYSVVADASGNAVVEIFSKSRNRNWIVQQVSVRMASAPAGTTCVLEKNGIYVTTMIPTGDSAAGDPPILLRGISDKLTVRWQHATPGNLATVLAIFDEVIA